MNRELKFRVWSNVKKDWVQNMMLLACIDGLPFAHFVELDDEKNLVKHHIYNASNLELTIQQYTGLKDKNGKEIYEGDIVKFARTRIESIEESPKIFTAKLIELGEDVGEIVYMGFSFCISFDHKRYDDIETLGNYPHRFEVIGNIYENPELLKQC